MDNNMQQIGRLAMRQEGDNWVAYYASNETMDDAIFLGSIHMFAIVDNPERKQAFMNMMRDVVSDIHKKIIGKRPEWGGEVPAPEHERSGSA